MLLYTYATKLARIQLHFEKAPVRSVLSPIVGRALNCFGAEAKLHQCNFCRHHMIHSGPKNNTSESPSKCTSFQLRAVSYPE